MFMRLSLSPKTHTLFVHIIPKAEICLVAYKNEVQDVGMVFDLLTDGLPKRHISQLYLHWFEVVKS